MPAPAQNGVHNLLDNLGEPVTAINEVVQGDPSRAATTIARFLVNSTLGLAGLFDVATSFGLTKTKEDFGKTVGYYAGVEPENGGFYMVLPLVGPSNARDAAGLMADYAVDPFRILTYRPEHRLPLYRACATARPWSMSVRARCMRWTTSRRTASTTMPRCARPTPSSVPT